MYFPAGVFVEVEKWREGRRRWLSLRTAAEVELPLVALRESVLPGTESTMDAKEAFGFLVKKEMSMPFLFCCDVGSKGTWKSAVSCLVLGLVLCPMGRWRL